MDRWVLKGRWEERPRCLFSGRFILGKKYMGLRNCTGILKTVKSTCVYPVLWVCAHMWVRVCASVCHHPETHRGKVRTSWPQPPPPWNGRCGCSPLLDSPQTPSEPLWVCVAVCQSTFTFLFLGAPRRILVPWPGIEPAPTMEAQILTTRPQGKSPVCLSGS